MKNNTALETGLIAAKGIVAIIPTLGGVITIKLRSI